MKKTAVYNKETFQVEKPRPFGRKCSRKMFHLELLGKVSTKTEIA